MTVTNRGVVYKNTKAKSYSVVYEHIENPINRMSVLHNTHDPGL